MMSKFDFYRMQKDIKSKNLVEFFRPKKVLKNETSDVKKYLLKYGQVFFFLLANILMYLRDYFISLHTGNLHLAHKSTRKLKKEKQSSLLKLFINGKDSRN